MVSDDDKLPTRSSENEVADFLAKAAALPSRGNGSNRGRLIFAMDATASREQSWDQACSIQAGMFEEAAALGGLDIQLCFYRGLREVRASRWQGDTVGLARLMGAVRCSAGATQIGRILDHTLRETAKRKVDALVFVGDAVEEGLGALRDRAGRLGLYRVPGFFFHEGNDPAAASAFRDMAGLSGGAACTFDAGSAAQLRDLLSAVAVYAAGGRAALEAFGERKGKMVRSLTHQVGRGS